jgi:hypothetical protein
MQELQKWSTEKGIVSLTILSSGKARSDYLEPTKAEAFNKARGGVPLALLIDASGDMGHAYGALTANHLFIVDRSVLVYAGGIDDAESMDPKKVLSARSCVHPALEDVLAGRPSSEPVPILPDAQSLTLRRSVENFQAPAQMFGQAVASPGSVRTEWAPLKAAS